jgi:hypothetical protein
MVQILKMVRILKNGAPGVLTRTFLADAGRARGGGHSIANGIFIAEGQRPGRVVSSNNSSPDVTWEEPSRRSAVPIDSLAGIFLLNKRKYLVCFLWIH